MFCSKCGQANVETERFCRKCGNDLPALSIMSVGRMLEPSRQGETRDPDALTSNGIASVIIGDGFFMVAVILALVQSSVSSMLWLVLLIPAFFFFAKGFADVLHARQIRKRIKTEELTGRDNHELPPGRPIAIEAFQKVISGELTPMPSVTERTTRDLK